MANTKEVTFSSREMEVLALAWQCMETQPKIDMVKLAALTGYTPGSTSVTLGKIKQKIKMVGGDSASASTTAGAVGGDAGPGMPTPRKRKAKAPLEKKTPRKSAKKGSPVGGSSPTPASLFKEENDEEFDMITVKKEEPVS